jgi:hypothetical protein
MEQSIAILQLNEMLETAVEEKDQNLLDKIVGKADFLKALKGFKVNDIESIKVLQPDSGELVINIKLYYPTK